MFDHNKTKQQQKKVLLKARFLKMPRFEACILNKRLYSLSCQSQVFKNQEIGMEVKISFKTTHQFLASRFLSFSCPHFQAYFCKHHDWKLMQKIKQKKKEVQILT